MVIGTLLFLICMNFLHAGSSMQISKGSTVNLDMATQICENTVIASASAGVTAFMREIIYN
jgi:hypothetical protein